MNKYCFTTKAGIKIILTRSSFKKVQKFSFLPAQCFVIKRWDLGLKDFYFILYGGEFNIVEITYNIDLIPSYRSDIYYIPGDIYV